MLVLREPCLEDEKSVLEFKKSFSEIKEEFPMEGLSNYLFIFNYNSWLNTQIKNKTANDKYFSNQTTYILVDDEDNRIYGACNIRHPLIGNLFNIGGNIGYAVRPDERGKGYGEKLLRLCLLKCKEVGLYKVLITARNENVQSINLIVKCGGVRYDDYLDPESGITFHRYWIYL